MKKFLQSRALRVVILCSFLIGITGCGYLLHPDRRVAPKSDKLDGGIVVMDCLWLLAFVVPGVIALIVDGTHGTWYYSESEADALGNNIQAGVGEELLVRLHGPAPEGAQVSLSLVDGRNQEILQHVEQQVVTGEELSALSLEVPPELEGRDGRLELAVNGLVHLQWSVQVQ